MSGWEKLSSELREGLPRPDLVGVRQASSGGDVSGTPKKPELFTVQVQGKGIRTKDRVPGWMVAEIIRYIKENKVKP